MTTATKLLYRLATLLLRGDKYFEIFRVSSLYLNLLFMSFSPRINRFLIIFSFVSTRWSSIHIMVESIVQNYSVIHSLLQTKYTNRKNLILSNKEQRGLKKLLGFLLPFRHRTDRMQAEKWPTQSCVAPAIHYLKLICEKEENPAEEEQLDSEEEDDDPDSLVYFGKGLMALKSKVFAALEFKFPEVDKEKVLLSLKASNQAQLDKKRSKEFPLDITSLLATSLDIRFRGFVGNLNTKVFLRILFSNINCYSIFFSFLG